MLEMFFIVAYRFQIAGYRDEVEYKAFKKVEQVNHPISTLHMQLMHEYILMY